MFVVLAPQLPLTFSHPVRPTLNTITGTVDRFWTKMRCEGWSTSRISVKLVTVSRVGAMNVCAFVSREITSGVSIATLQAVIESLDGIGCFMAQVAERNCHQ
jgi:hypothetical protein